MEAPHCKTTRTARYQKKLGAATGCPALQDPSAGETAPNAGGSKQEQGNRQAEVRPPAMPPPHPVLMKFNKPAGKGNYMKGPDPSFQRRQKG